MSLATAQISEDQVKFFETKIRPILAKHCYQCHGNKPDKVEKELVLTTAHGIRHGGQSGSIIVAGKPDKSLLILAIRHSTPNLQMPADKLPPEVIRNFERWVEEGAFDPRNDTDYETQRLVESNKEYDFSQDGKHWAYQPLRKPELPEVNDSGWIQSPIDRFILSKLGVLNKSFNQDKPYDQFVKEQIAGDLPPDLTDDSARFEALTGTGFWMLGSKVLDLKD